MLRLRNIWVTVKFYFKCRIWKIFAKLQLIFELCKYFWRKMYFFVKFLQIWHINSIFEVFLVNFIKKENSHIQDARVVGRDAAAKLQRCPWNTVCLHTITHFSWDIPSLLHPQSVYIIFFIGIPPFAIFWIVWPINFTRLSTTRRNVQTSTTQTYSCKPRGVSIPKTDSTLIRLSRNFL